MPMPDWDRIRRHYDGLEEKIITAPRNEWGVDPYAWESAGITLTPIESWLWDDIRTVDLVLYPQYPIGRFIVDFANPRAKVVIECDGAEFHKDKHKDAIRDAVLQAKGWTVYRLSGKDCRDGVGGDHPWDSAARKTIEMIGRNHRIRRSDA